MLFIKQSNNLLNRGWSYVIMNKCNIDVLLYAGFLDGQNIMEAASTCSRNDRFQHCKYKTQKHYSIYDMAFIV